MVPSYHLSTEIPTPLVLGVGVKFAPWTLHVTFVLIGQWRSGNSLSRSVRRVVKKTVFFNFVFFSGKKHVFFVFFSFFSVFFLASDFFIFKDLTYNYCKLMMLFKTQTFHFY